MARKDYLKRILSAYILKRSDSNLSFWHTPLSINQLDDYDIHNVRRYPMNFIAKTIFKKLKIKTTLEPCRLADYPQVAKRPLNCILENRLLKKQGLNLMPEWEEDVITYLNQFGKELVKSAKAKRL